MLIRDVEIPCRRGAAIGDVRLRGGVIEALAARLGPQAGEVVVEGRGGALLPGLHDHHIHLFSLAAALRSVRCGPPEVADSHQLARALQAAGASAAGPDAWIRGVGYHESVAGALDAAALENFAPAQPIRIQHRSGALWILNRAALERLELTGKLPASTPAGVERDRRGCATGRLYRVDGWLRDRIGAAAVPALRDTSAMLSRFGVTGVTDATPGNDVGELHAIERAVVNGELQQQVQLMGRPTLPQPAQTGVSRGAVKLVVSEAGCLDLEALTLAVQDGHRRGRPVAIHCVTRAELVLALAAIESAGARRGDRIEHASIAPPELADRLARLGLQVVTQPNFIRERGDVYRRDVEHADQPWLYRCQGLLDAGVALAGGTDAPFGDPNPWLAMQAALDRRTAAGIVLAEHEALSPERALALFTTHADEPGGAPREIAAGEIASLCLLDRSWARARDALDPEHVAATWSAGKLSWQRDADTQPHHPRTPKRLPLS